MESKTPEQEELEAERVFHETGQRNAIGGYIGCDGPVCSAQIKQIMDDNFGQKIQTA